MSTPIYSVTQVTQHIKSMLDSDAALARIYIRGELSNYKRYPSGHHYFSIKDENASLKCVMFRASASRLRFRPETGMKVIAFGRVTVYPRDGVYQFYVDAMSPEGVGELYVAFEQLKTRLGQEGLFDEAHKKPLPAFPGTIGLVTSSAGAAVHDMLRILKARWPMAKVRLLAVRVQGAEAPPEIAAAIAYANRWKLADLLIVGRGGGSMEDLWCFNDERVARAIYASEIPVISAVGHEPDVTIADFVADVRAATPSNGAELAVPDQNDVSAALRGYDVRLRQQMNRRLQTARAKLECFRAARVLQSPTVLLEDRAQRLDRLSERLSAVLERRLTRERNRVALAAAGLDAMSPLKVLARGYTLTRDGEGRPVTSAASLAPGDRIETLFRDGTVASLVERVERTAEEGA